MRRGTVHHETRIEERAVTRTVKGTTLYLALWRTTRGVQRVAEADIAGSGLCLTDFAVLEALLNTGPQRVTSIAEKVMLTSGSMTTAVDRLAARGLVRRTPDESDARARVIELTDEGRTLIQPVFAAHESVLDDAFAGLSGDERASLLALLLKVRSDVRTPV